MKSVEPRRRCGDLSERADAEGVERENQRDAAGRPGQARSPRYRVGEDGPEAQGQRVGPAARKRDLDGQRREISYSYAASPLFRLPAGEYYVTVERGSARATAEVQIEAGRLRESTLQVAVE